MSEFNQYNMAVGEWQHGVVGTPFDNQAAVQEMDTLPVPPEQVYAIPAEAAEVTGVMPAGEVTYEEPAAEETAGFAGEPVAEDTVAPDMELVEEETEESAEEQEGEDTAESIQTEEQPQEEDEETKRAKHEAAEAERKAEWEARQRQKKDALRKQKEELAGMSEEELVKKSMERVSADTEKLTRRNMKDCVAEYIQTLCLEDPDFARMVMDPRKSMVHCFQYINRKAWDYVQDEMKANDVKPGTGQQGYGSDIPDGLCYQWAEDYFRNPLAKEDEEEEEKFVPKPYVGKAGYKPAAKKKTEKKEKKAKAPEKKPEQEKKAENVQVTGQLSLMDMMSRGSQAS